MAMTSLVQDAMCTKSYVPVRNFKSTKMNPEILQDIINAKDLDEREVISILFLVVDKDTDFPRVIQEIKEDPWTAFVRLTSQNNWTKKLLESLILIGNKEVVKKMGFNKNDIQYVENVKDHKVSSHLNPAIKSLYLLCENLDKNEVMKLVTDVNNKLRKPVDIDHSKLYLELYILEWLYQRYISIDPDNIDLSNLVKNLKHISCLVDLPFHFDNWENHGSSINKNEKDSQTNPQISNGKSTSQHSTENSLALDIKWSNPNHKKLCIIINQIKFTDGKKYVEREGSEIDERSLKETLEGCDFYVMVYRDQTKQEMINRLKSLNDDKSYSMYGAIFICILSHGLRGEIVFSDDKALSIDIIKENICCKNLQSVFKFLILQSCQGTRIGMVEKESFKKAETELVEDGPLDSDSILNPMHFCLFQATIENFAAMRHKREGSWFIQDMCQEIREANKPIEVGTLIQKVTARVTNRRAPYNDQFKLQLPKAEIIYPVPYEIPTFERKI